MKIVKVEVFLTGAVWRNFLFVKLTADSGLVGWGDGTLEWKESTVRDLILDLGRRYVIGHNPFDIEDLWFKLYQIEHNTGPIMYAAMAGIETAMWDIVGKAKCTPTDGMPTKVTFRSWRPVLNKLLAGGIVPLSSILLVPGGGNCRGKILGTPVR